MGEKVEALHHPINRRHLARIENPGFNKVRPFEFGGQRVDQASEDEPVQHFLLAGVLDLRQRVVAPEGMVALLQRLVSSPQDVVYLSLAVTSLQINHLDQLFR